MTALAHGKQDMALPLSRRMPTALAAIFLGTFLILGVGLVQIEAVHNAAHDARHGISFPCH
ncbi:MAG: cobalt transporter [Alphaproteobacteria bacterium]|nr:cobalt transporter [Alphaproteobacteria bacterium]